MTTRSRTTASRRVCQAVAHLRTPAATTRRCRTSRRITTARSTRIRRPATRRNPVTTATTSARRPSTVAVRPAVTTAVPRVAASTVVAEEAATSSTALKPPLHMGCAGPFLDRHTPLFFIRTHNLYTKETHGTT